MSHTFILSVIILLLICFFFIFVAYFLNPKYQYRDNLGRNAELLDAMHKVYMQLDPVADGLSQFGNEVIYMKILHLQSYFLLNS